MATDDIKETADAVGEAAGIIERGVEAVAEQIAELAATYGELAWETTLTIVRVDAGHDLFIAALFFSLATGYLVKVMLPGGLFWQALKRQRDADALADSIPYCTGDDARDAERREARRESDRQDTRSVILAVVAVPSFIAWAASVCVLLNVWNWIALSAPELYLAKRALDAVVSL